MRRLPSPRRLPDPLDLWPRLTGAGARAPAREGRCHRSSGDRRHRPVVSLPEEEFTAAAVAMGGGLYVASSIGYFVTFWAMHRSAGRG
jgi:hypothetical protein